jgi:murein DD-endopeptidase MepM/ murein hydrolase activator NlpD
MKMTRGFLGYIALISCLPILTSPAAQAVNAPLPMLSFASPLEPPIKLINQYRQPNSDYSAGHRGVDYLVKIGQKVLSPADGQVWFSGKVVNRRLISISHTGNYLSEFEPLCSELKRGERVFKGQEIGRVCAADASYIPHCETATCLHFSLRNSGSYLSPLVLIGELNPSRLLPLEN